MFILGKTWTDGFLDHARAPGELRIRAWAWWPLERLVDVYLAQPRSLRRLWNYLREVGAKELLLKVRSRLAESLRDRKFISAGFGEVLEADADAVHPVGAAVAFVAPWHPECMQRVCLPPAFVTPIDDALAQRWRRDEALLLIRNKPNPQSPDWSPLAGWSRFSGAPIDQASGVVLGWATEQLRRIDPASCESLASPRAAVAAERTPSVSPQSGRMSAVLFGLGNYAKTCIIPKLDPRIQLTCIHEIDPTQIGVNRLPGVSYDTSGAVRPDEKYDVYLIAGYHHTHADLAVHALRSGAWAVVEKPIVTTREQLDALLATMKDHPGRFFAGLNKRYDPLWGLARQDLQLAPGEPVNYHCIVFEVPLVRRHWYNWPNSGSRIVSNGTHWLDHFQFMNGFAAPCRADLWKARNGDIHASVELDNGATFNMSLTDHGSARLGLQDHIQLRAKGVTVTVENASRYRAEDRFRVLRRKHVNRLTAFRVMYETISRKIVAGEPGDSVDSVRRSSELMLALEAQVQRANSE